MRFFRSKDSSHRCPGCGENDWTAWQDLWLEIITGLPGISAEMYKHRYVEMRQVKHCQACNWAETRIVGTQRIPNLGEWQARQAQGIMEQTYKLGANGYNSNNVRVY